MNTNMDVHSDLKEFGNYFIREYYTFLSECSQNLSKYYNDYSIFVHCVSATETESVIGQKEILDCIIRLGYKGCNTNILSVNTQYIFKYIVISVVGELTKCNSAKKIFSQTIVLHRNTKNEYLIKNNMFFYTDNIDDITHKHVEDNIDLCTRDWKNTTYGKNQNLHNIIDSSHPPKSHQLFVSGIPANAQPQELRQFFEQFGPLYSLRIMKRNLNYGFITYAKSESAQKVLQNRPILFPNDTGVMLVVKEKKTNLHNKDNIYLPNSHQLFIGDIPDDITSDELKIFFSAWGMVMNARILVTRGTPGSASEIVQGFVTFETEYSAKAVLQNKPIVFPDKNGVELKVMEKLCRLFSDKNIVQECKKK